MKIINLIIAILCLASFQLGAQDDKNKDKDKDKKRSIDINFGDDNDDEEYDYDQDHDHDHDHGDNHNDNDNNNKRTSMRFGMVDLGVSSYLYEGSGLNMPDELSYMDQRLGKSINIGIHIVDLKLGLSGKNKPQYLGVSTGVRLNLVHYSFENDFALIQDQATFEDAVIFDVREISKHRLYGNYVMIPAMIEINTKPQDSSKSFNLAFGYVHNFLLNSNHKIKYDDKEKSKVKDDFNLNKSFGMLEGRIGYGPLNFYVQYGLDGLFQANNGPELTPINFGVNIIPR